MEMPMRGTRFTFYPWKSDVPLNSGGGRWWNFLSSHGKGSYVFNVLLHKLQLEWWLFLEGSGISRYLDSYKSNTPLQIDPTFNFS